MIPDDDEPPPIRLLRLCADCDDELPPDRRVRCRRCTEAAVVAVREAGGRTVLPSMIARVRERLEEA